MKKPGAAAGLVRFGVAMEGELLSRFDDLIARRGWKNRSEALRDLVRRALDQDAWESGGRVVATVTLVYDHHVRELTERLTEIQHDFGSRIISTLHVHLDHDHCMEVIAARGQAADIKRLTERLLGAKGVLSGDVTAARLPDEPTDPHHGALPETKRRGGR
ncbi:MAG TPA: nickel-responsive transcriptional regulator NikR [Polyangiaceae bacterium]|nr:nickel-responsive transcriptional regulator NikR [Polyangiaceae bacterium]